MALSTAGVISKYLKILLLPAPTLAIPVRRITTVELLFFEVSVIDNPIPPKVTVPLLEPVLLVAFTNPVTYDDGATVLGLFSAIAPLAPKSIVLVLVFNTPEVKVMVPPIAQLAAKVAAEVAGEVVLLSVKL